MNHAGSGWLLGSGISHVRLGYLVTGCCGVCVKLGILRIVTLRLSQHVLQEIPLPVAGGPSVFSHLIETGGAERIAKYFFCGYACMVL